MTTTDCAETPATTTLWRLAARDTASLSAGIVPFGLMLGVTATAMHSGATATWLGALLIFGGSAQLTTLTLLHLGAGLLGAVVSGAVVNARLLLYGAAMGPRFAGQPLWFRLLAADLIQDQTYLSATGRPEIEGSAFRRYWGWLGGLLLGSWVAVGGRRGSPSGRSCRRSRTSRWSAPPCSSRCSRPGCLARPAIAGAAAAASVAVVVNSLLPSLGIIAGAAAGLLVSLRVEGGRS